MLWPNPSEVLGLQRMCEFIAELSSRSLVIIDAPPVIPVTDAAVLAHGVDGMLLVVRSRKTTVDALRKAHQNVEAAGGRVVGVVLNRSPRRGTRSAYYGYQYTGEQGWRAEDDLPDVVRVSARKRARTAAGSRVAPAL